MDDGGLDAGSGCRIPSRDLRWRFTTSGGPGGQHANRSQTTAELTIDLESAVGVDDGVRQRLVERLGPVLRVSVDDTRSQTRNREIALERATAMLRSARQRPKARRATKPSRSAKRRRVEAKRRRSQTKRDRRRPGPDD
ncbi:MAG: alternative ribosome rescue aminoacyl-tRNA hydrolase ArfB [Acidimicrobiia bacterium]|nr:alternative ribosome rescue aminoacyl-tRNA hydrolase ArfB [Acidimicrobiia bacterium]